jgi:hypothetical protein
VLATSFASYQEILTPLRDLRDAKLRAAEQGKASAAFNGSKNKDLLKYIHNCVSFPDLVVSGFPWRHMTSSSIQTISCNKDTDNIKSLNRAGML